MYASCFSGGIRGGKLARSAGAVGREEEGGLADGEEGDVVGERKEEGGDESS